MTDGVPADADAGDSLPLLLNLGSLCSAMSLTLHTHHVWHLAWPRRRRGASFFGTTRDDFAAKNEAARAAVEKFGELPQDAPEGTHRSRFAPPIARRGGSSESSAVPTAVDPTSTSIDGPAGAAARDENATE